MYRLQQNLRWFGPHDPVSLADIRQSGATSVVTALHEVPNGDCWPLEDIRQRKYLIENAGLSWSVVESLPVSEEIKTQRGAWKQHIDNYKSSLSNLAECGIQVVAYNFMPVLDWSRTDCEYIMPDGSVGLRFDKAALVAFDLGILERPGAAEGYSEDELVAGEELLKGMTGLEEKTLTSTILAGLPGSVEGYDLSTFREQIACYADISPEVFRGHLVQFLEAIVPVAEDLGIAMAIHPDDPPFSILGLPRVVSTTSDLKRILDSVNSHANGLCFCSGSLGVRSDNDLLHVINEMGNRIHFVHLRNIRRTAEGSFYESDHLEGDIDMYEIQKALFALQQRRSLSIPMRPDHGHKMLDDLSKDSNPGYSAIGRLRGLAELRGIEYAISHS